MAQALFGDWTGYVVETHYSAVWGDQLLSYTEKLSAHCAASCGLIVEISRAGFAWAGVS